ncbi:MAG: hypothetical protein CVU84_15135 [Firmicutes bacterium HGW-Firmicutes-1]|jgi:hypothetical protein|nr:MAG: hypothetical protein CVU84_15135 [Firmicutes bacterium HGW-Firmicutes-1]
MNEYRREYPFFSLCGLNCGLCPRFQTKGESKCPGCGGKDFHIKHPSCAIITCNKKHSQVEYCFQCASFPCKKYSDSSNVDSFISYRNVITDFEKVSNEGLDKYKIELNQKIEILEFLINNYNDGRRKNFYCIAVNIMQLNDLENIMAEINENISKEEIPIKEKLEQIRLLFEIQASKDNIELKLRKG